MSKREPKYAPLNRYLRSAGHPVILTFDEMGRIVGGLPPSAYRHRAWWSNNSTHVVAQAWLELGRRVEEVDLVRQVVQIS